MTDAKIWIVILGLALATYVIRISFLALLAGRRLPEPVTRALGFVPVTVLPALFAPMVLKGPEGGLGITPEIFVPAMVALAAGMITRNVLAGILGGFAGFAAVTLAL
jgi:branched-subunit amino acid transport protein